MIIAPSSCARSSTTPPFSSECASRISDAPYELLIVFNVAVLVVSVVSRRIVTAASHGDTYFVVIAIECGGADQLRVH